MYKSDLFFSCNNKEITYEELIIDINEKEVFKRYIVEIDPYKIILNLVHSLVNGLKVELLDNNFSKEEMKNLGIELSELNKEIKIENKKAKNYDELIKIIDSQKENWELTLYTSGTTGRPKKVIHNLEMISRGVKFSEKHKYDIWGLAYNLTHFAGLQVFFQAFYNKNPIIYLFNLDKKEVEEKFIKYKITNISATPTYYRSIIPYLNKPITTVKKITMGGERYDQTIEKTLKDKFPNAIIKNVYASTEAGSLFSADGEVFHISTRIKDKVKINEDNELMIHKSLLGESDSLNIIDNWYKTGDIVEQVDEEHLKFVSRKTEMINVGGYKVNPHEVENEIKKINGIIDVLVSSKENKITGNILIAEIMIDDRISEKEMEKEINKILKDKLQPWKIPRIIKFVKELEKTRTEKKLRK